MKPLDDFVTICSVVPQTAVASHLPDMCQSSFRKISLMAKRRIEGAVHDQVANLFHIPYSKWCLWNSASPPAYEPF
jgi:hypothetical protein